MDGDPASAGITGKCLPRVEIALTVLAGLKGKLRAAGTGHIDDLVGVEIDDSSGHFEPTDGLINLGVEKFNEAGIDVFPSSWRDGDWLRQFAPD